MVVGLSLFGGFDGVAVGGLVLLVGLGFRGVLKGDLKGLERVWEALSRRRRLLGGDGDMLRFGRVDALDGF